MRLCPQCGLRVKAMLSRSALSFSQASPPSFEQHEALDDPESTLNIEERPTRIEAAVSPTPPASQNPPEALDDQTGPPDVEALPKRVEAAVSPALPASQKPQETLDDPEGTLNIEEQPTRIEAAVSPALPATQNPPEALDDQTGPPDVEALPTRVEAAVSPAPQESQTSRNEPDNASFRSSTSLPWAAQKQAQPRRFTLRMLDPRLQRQRRMGLVLILLSMLLVLGGGGYLVYSLVSGFVQPPIKTTNMNIVINYVGIDITILNVQQAQKFVDDPQTSKDGMLRLNLQEQNKTTAPISWNYKTSARLIVPGSPAIAPVYVTSTGYIASGATQTSILDFPIAHGGNLNTLIFQLGTSNEAQIQVPLTGQAKLDQYQPKTSQQNGTMTYFGLNWTLTSITTSLSIPGQQAPSGMKFLTLTLRVDSALSQEAITGSPFDYLRVQAGGKTVGPVDTTLPVSFAGGETGQMGTATFLIPQSSNSCTLILLSQDSGNNGQASTDFQVS